ncbi:unnamed protein product [Effrenium voratum]|uniref:Uncharacterized protein n=1 Tax=Effrenium voratum TaxID=2562239 RepID=A0AA36JN62_9DINO|nr:unnamed protein product [Effrenium voratum]
MLALLSPAKTMDMAPAKSSKSQPQLAKHTEELLKVLKKLPAAELKRMMGLSPELTKQTAARFVYSLYLESISLTTTNASLTDREAFCRWTLKGLEDRSPGFTLRCEPHGWQGFCSFIVASFPTPHERNLCVRLALSPAPPLGSLPQSDLATAFVDLADLSAEERFKVDFLELRDTELQVVAVAKLHSASQQRWTTERTSPPKQARFLDYTTDAQARRLYEHIAAAAGIAGGLRHLLCFIRLAVLQPTLAILGVFLGGSLASP